MSRTASIALLAAGLTISQAAAQAPQREPVVLQGNVRADALVQEFTGAMASRDADRIAMLFSEQAVILTPEGPVITGRAQIKALYARVFASGQVAMTLTHAQADGDQANAVLLWVWNLEVAIPGRDTIRRRIRSMLHLKSTGSGWQIVSDLYQVVPPG